MSRSDISCPLRVRAWRFSRQAACSADSPVRSFCPNSGFTIGEHILTFQGHPEFSKGYSRALIELRRELLGETGYSNGVESLAKPVHQSMVGRWIINFIASNAAERS